MGKIEQLKSLIEDMVIAIGVERTISMYKYALEHSQFSPEMTQAINTELEKLRVRK